MKAKLKARILSAEKNTIVEHGKTDHSGMTRISISSGGKVDTAHINAQLAFLNGNIFLKEMIADQIKIGATITITISDEEPSE